MSVTISCLRHHGWPGLHADQCVNAPNRMPRPMEMGISFRRVSPAAVMKENKISSMANLHQFAVRYRRARLRWREIMNKDGACSLLLWVALGCFGHARQTSADLAREQSEV